MACIAGVVEPDAGEIRFDGEPLPPVARASSAGEGLEVVWQDHGLCDDLDVAANVVLGREGRVPRPAGQPAGRGHRRALRGSAPTTSRSTARSRTLSRGQKQLVALARSLLAEPEAARARRADRVAGRDRDGAGCSDVVAETRERGAGVLLVTHDLEQVFGLADRIVVLRQGRIVADVSPMEVQRADLVALMSGIEMDSTAHRQLHRLRSLVDQLSDVEPAASLPLIVSAMAAALEQEMLCVHLLDASGDEVAPAALGGRRPARARCSRSTTACRSGSTARAPGSRPRRVTSSSSTTSPPTRCRTATGAGAARSGIQQRVGGAGRRHARRARAR